MWHIERTVSWSHIIHPWWCTGGCWFTVAQKHQCQTRWRLSVNHFGSTLVQLLWPLYESSVWIFHHYYKYGWFAVLTTLRVVKHRQTDSVGGLTTWHHLNKMGDAKYTHTSSTVRSLTVQECWELRCSAARLSFFVFCCYTSVMKKARLNQHPPMHHEGWWQMIKITLSVGFHFPC